MESARRTKIHNITLIQLDNRYPDLGYRLIMPRYGTVVIGTILKDLGYDVKIYAEHVQPPDWDRIKESDAICFSMMSAAANKTYALIEKIHVVSAAPIIIGGTHATFFPDDVLNHADFVVRQEGDITLPALLKALQDNTPLETILGISYKVNGHIHHTPDRPGPSSFSTGPDYSLVAGYDRFNWFRCLLTLRKRMISLQASRGCDRSCKFCITPRMFGQKNLRGVYQNEYRQGCNASLVETLKHNRDRFGKDFYFVDNQLVICDKPEYREHTKDLFWKIIEAKLDISFGAEVSLEIADDKEMLDLMRKAGCKTLGFGFESVAQPVLDRMAKGQQADDYLRRIKNVKEAGIDVNGYFIFGADEDTVDTIRDDVKFAIESGLQGAYFFILGDYKGLLGKDGGLIPPERMFVNSWDYLNGFFVCHFPKNMKPSRLQRELINAYSSFYSISRIVEDLCSGRFLQSATRAFIRLTAHSICKTLKNHIPFLEEIEKGKYNCNGQLKEELLRGRLKSAYFRCAKDAKEKVAGESDRGEINYENCRGK